MYALLDEVTEAIWLLHYGAEMAQVASDRSEAIDEAYRLATLVGLRIEVQVYDGELTIRRR